MCRKQLFSLILCYYDIAFPLEKLSGGFTALASGLAMVNHLLPLAAGCSNQCLLRVWKLIADGICRSAATEFHTDLRSSRARHVMSLVFLFFFFFFFFCSFPGKSMLEVF